jgi:dUTPase
VRPDILERVQKEIKIKRVDCCLKTVTGETAPIIGQARLHFQLGNYETYQDVWLAEITDPCIIGLDFLAGNNCRVDVAGALLQIGEVAIPMLQKKQNGLRCCRVVATQNIKIPPRSESVIPGTLVGEIDSTWGSVGPRSKVKESDNLLIAGTLVNVGCRKNFPIRLMNISDREQTIKKGKHIANFEPVEFVIEQECKQVGPVKQEVNSKLPTHLEELCERSKQCLDEGQQKHLEKFLTEFQDVFSRDSSDLGRTGITKHKIDVGDIQPIRQPTRTLPLAKKEEAAKIVTEMEEQGVIEPSCSPWVSPVVLVKKKDGSTRFCVDYRKLNAVTKKDSYPLPRIDTSLHSFQGSTFFSTLDLKSGYWQVEVEQSDKEKTAFSTGEGLWQFRVMPFGLTNAPATFERLMEQVLTGLPWTVCLVYLDDIIVHANSFQEELRHLTEVLNRLRSANLKLNPKKCHLFQRKVIYLGYIVGQDGIETNPSKTRVIQDWPIPTNISELRSFVGLCSYYRRFVKDFAKTASPLNKMLSKDVKFEWTNDCQIAWETLKHCLVTAPILSYPCSEGNFILDTDASYDGLGAVLSQEQEGTERVIGYFSRTLTKAERNYCVTRKELLAVVAAVEHFNYFLYGRPFIIRTDHSALQWMMNFRNIQGQLARWLEKLQQYDFSIVHRRGVKHGNADALSRRPCAEHDCVYCLRREAEDKVNGQEKEQRASLGVSIISPENRLTKEEIRDAQTKDEGVGPVLRWFEESLVRPDWSVVAPCSKVTKVLWAQWDSLRLREGCLYRKWEDVTGESNRLQLIVPKVLQSDILKQLHGNKTAGHFGVNKTLQRVKERFYWPLCGKDVRD